MLALMVLSALGDFRHNRVLQYLVRSDCCDYGSLHLPVFADMRYRHTWSCKIARKLVHFVT